MKKKILYIMGNARSGSTIFDIILSGANAIKGMGELTLLQDVGWIRNEYCACGSKVLECPFWSKVKENVQESADISNDEYIRIVNKIENDDTYYYEYMHNNVDADLEKYIQYNKVLFEKIFLHAGTNAIVDSSKTPNRALYLSLLNDMYDVYILHIVRDSRAVAWSIKKPLKQNLEKGVATEQSGKPYFKSVKRWIGNAVKCLKVKKAVGDDRYLLVNYDELIQNNRKALQKISDFTGVDLHDVIQTLENGGTLDPEHTVAGSRIRMKKGIRLQHDDGWRREMPWIPKFVTTILTLPLLQKFGFSIFK